MTTNFKHQAFREDLLTWFEREKEDYPWRRTNDPWEILVSEVMLQQTQVATVLGKGFYTSFLERFPDVASIAVANEQEILREWEGLGYYRRVRNLQKTAQAVVEQYGGVFPKQHDELLGLPGVGPYTAAAVSSFAYRLPQALVDANVARLFSRLFDYREQVDSTQGLKQLWSWADELLDREHPSAYNSALMEIGQKVCKNKKPQCMLCPVRSHCKTDDPEQLPMKKPKRATIEVTERCILMIRSGKILLEQQDKSQRREGMWSLPKRKGYQEKMYLVKTKYGITNHKVTLYIYKGEKEKALKNEKWIPLEEVEKLPMPSPFRKVLKKLLKE